MAGALVFSRALSLGKMDFSNHAASTSDAACFDGCEISMNKFTMFF